MRRADVSIFVDSNSRDIEYCVLEGIELDPRKYFRFKEGQWEGEFPNFPIEDDNDLDVLIIARGNPRTDSSMTVIVGNNKPKTSTLFKPFSRNGYGVFGAEIPA